MKDNELRVIRNRALYETYKKGLEEGRFSSMRDAGRYVCRQPAPRFYISSEVASDIIGRIIARKSLINLNSCYRRRAWRLYDEYCKYLEEHPGCRLSRERVMEIIVEMPAPEFYIEPQHTRKILQKEIKKVRARWEY